MQQDRLWRFMFEEGDVRGEVTHIDACWQEILQQRDYPPRLRRLLGELVAAAALLAANLKFEGSLQLQLRGDGPLRLAVVECTHDLGMRAIARWEGAIGETLTLRELLGAGTFALMLEQKESRQPYQGIVMVEGDSVAQALEAYLARSEQIETRIWLVADARQAAGMLLQRLPQVVGRDADLWNRVGQLAATITSEELCQLPTRELLHRLFHEEQVRLFDPVPVSFACTCSVERVRSVLRMLGADELHAILAEQGKVSVDCEYCGKHYAFDAVDAEQVLAAQVVSPAGETRH